MPVPWQWTEPTQKAAHQGGENKVLQESSAEYVSSKYSKPSFILISSCKQVSASAWHVHALTIPVHALTMCSLAFEHRLRYIGHAFGLVLEVGVHASAFV